MFKFSLGFKPLYRKTGGCGFLWKFPGQAQASLVSQRLTGNDVRVGGPHKRGWGLVKVGGA